MSLQHALIKEEVQWPDEDLSGKEVTVPMYDALQPKIEVEGDLKTPKHENDYTDAPEGPRLCTKSEAIENNLLENLLIEKEIGVRVKEEVRSPENGVSETAAQAGLYDGCLVKEELVIGPEVVKSQDGLAAQAAKRNLRSRFVFSNQNTPEIKNQFCCKRYSKKSINNPAIEHKRTHMGKMFNCQICLFISIKYLDYHIGVHTGEKPFICEVCNKKFCSKDNLVEHRHIHEPFSCPICPEMFWRKAYLKEHKRSHTEENPFKCDLCKEQFNKKSNLNAHKLIHSGLDLFSCEVCDKKFSKKSKLIIHNMIIHKMYNQFRVGQNPVSIAVERKIPDAVPGCSKTMDTKCLKARQNPVFIESNQKLPSNASDSYSSSSSCDNSSTSSSSSDSSSSDPSCDSSSSESDNNNDHEPTEEKKGKKRVRKPKTRKTKIVKLLRNSGKSYQSLAKTKRQVPEKKIRPPCGDGCRLKCTSKIDEATRQILFDAYWALADLQRQREFIVRHTQEIKPKYIYSSTQNLRSLNSAFYFEVERSRVRVCKTFFKSTLDLNNRVITTALAKKSDSGILEGELRGKHGNHPTIDPEVKKSVFDFITSIPRIESHYLRGQHVITGREYICSDKSLADIFRDYKALREKDNLPCASQSTFNRIFNTEFNISFFIPKKDQCSLCENYQNAKETDKIELQKDYDQHLKERSLARVEKDFDKNRKDGVIVAVYDMQAVMQVPKGQVSLFFYKSRINCLNFTVSDLYAKDVMCYFWDEVEGKRGAVEIGSCVLNYIKTLTERNVDSDLDIIFYSDNCCGQQKNKYLLSVYAYAVMSMKVNSITHKYLIRGHTQNEGDNVHSVIEKQVKRYLKSGPIYTPQQYITLIRTSNKTGHPYTVVEMTHDKFYDVKSLQELWGKNFNIDEHKNQLNWHDIKMLKVEKSQPNAFFYKTSYEDDQFKKIYVHKKRTVELSSLDLTLAYVEKIPLTAAKKSDIKSLIDKNAIPRQYFESYYKNVLQ